MKVAMVHAQDRRNTRKTKEMKEKIMATRYELEKCEQFIRNACMVRGVPHLHWHNLTLSLLNQLKSFNLRA